MLELTIEKNRHTPILPMSVGHSPDPYAFKRAYLQTLGQWEAPADMPTLPKILQSVTPPDEKEIDDEAKRIYDKEFQPRIIIIDGKAQNEAEVKAQFEQTKQKLPEKMRRERAEQYKIYLEPDALEVSGPLDPKETKPATPDQIWYAQNMLWIDQDIAEAIARINKSSKNIMDAPVKQLIKVSVPNDASQYITLQNQLGAGAKGDNAPTLDDNALAGKAYAL
jgi:hypothetical protein